MSHDLMENDTMMYTGETPWHGLGVDMGLDPVSLKTALQVADLDWDVEKVALQTADGLTVPNMYATVRADTRTPLGVVGEQYLPVNNREAFGFVESILGAGNGRVHTAGSLRNQSRVWVLVSLRQREVVPGDAVADYLLVATSHDGSLALQALPTSVRVVCQNTLTMAIGSGRKSAVSVRHTRTAPQRMDTAAKVLRRTLGLLDKQAERHAVFAKTSMTTTMWNAFLERLYPVAGLEEGKGLTLRNNRRETLTNLFENGVGQDLPGVSGTAWAALNAVTQFTTHRNARQGSTRFENVVWGSGADLAIKAETELLDLITA